jgi:hypothetical protein
MYPLVPPPLSDTGAWSIPRTLQRWLDVNPITHLTRTQGYITLPAFNVNVNWLGYSDIVAAFNFEGPNNFSLSGFNIEPSPMPNYLLCIMWRDSKGNVKRYKLWSGVGEVLYFPIQAYSGQKIAKNFRFEVWSVSQPVTNVVYQGSPIPTAVVLTTIGETYTITPGVNENGMVLVNGVQSIVLVAGVSVTIVAQEPFIEFQYPNLIPNGSVYGPNLGSGYLFDLAQELGYGLPFNTKYNISFGIHEYNFINLNGVPGGLLSQGNIITEQFTTSVSANGDFIFASTAQGLSVTAAVYLSASGLPLTIRISQGQPSSNIIQIYTSVLGKQDYRYGTDFTLVVADIGVTNFATPNLDLPFVFPPNSYPQPN